MIAAGAVGANWSAPGTGAGRWAAAGKFGADAWQERPHPQSKPRFSAGADTAGLFSRGAEVAAATPRFEAAPVSPSQVIMPTARPPNSDVRIGS